MAQGRWTIDKRSGAPPRFTLPSVVYGVAGETFTVYKANVAYQGVLSSQNATGFTDAGDRWTYTPGAPGSYPLSITADGVTASTTLIATSGVVVGTRRVLVVGDSMTATDATWNYVKQVGDALGASATLVGTLTLQGYHQEGWSGKRFDWFASDPTSPMVTSGVLDVPHYLSLLSGSPDLVVWSLGTNDIFSALPSLGTDNVEDSITFSHTNADTLFSAFDAVLPSARHAVLTLLHGMPSETVWDATYPPETYGKRSWYLRKQQRFNERAISYFDRSRVTVVPIHLSVDQSTGYQDALHAGQTGHNAVARLVGHWIFGRWNG